MILKEGGKSTGKYMDEYKFVFKELIQDRQVKQFIND
jgi:hypothetical protein